MRKKPLNSTPQNVCNNLYVQPTEQKKIFLNYINTALVTVKCSLHITSQIYHIADDIFPCNVLFMITG